MKISLKKKTLQVLSMALAVLLLLSLSGCGQKIRIVGVIRQFQTACNDLDVEAAVACLDPSIGNVLNFGMDLIGSLLGKSNEEMFASLSGLLSEHSDSVGIESFKTLSIKVNDIAANDATADAKVLLTYQGSDGEEKQQDATLRLKYVAEDENWVISGVSFK